MVRGAAKRAALGSPGHGEFTINAAVAEDIGRWCIKARQVLRHPDFTRFVSSVRDDLRPGVVGGGRWWQGGPDGGRWHEWGERNWREKKGMVAVSR